MKDIINATAEYLYGEISHNRVAEWDDVQDGDTGHNYRELARGALRAALRAAGHGITDREAGDYEKALAE